MEVWWKVRCLPEILHTRFILNQRNLVGFMNIKNKLLRKLAKSKFIEWKPDYFTEDEKENENRYLVWKSEQSEKLKTGEDIEPPWFIYDHTMSEGIYNLTLSPWEMRHDYWLIEVWLPFWRELHEEKRQVYKTKFNMLDEWLEVATIWANNKTNEIS
jgi:hypothetical protein